MSFSSFIKFLKGLFLRKGVSSILIFQVLESEKSSGLLIQSNFQPFWRSFILLENRLFNKRERNFHLFFISDYKWIIGWKVSNKSSTMSPPSLPYLLFVSYYGVQNDSLEAWHIYRKRNKQKYEENDKILHKILSMRVVRFKKFARDMISGLIRSPDCF